MKKIEYIKDSDGYSKIAGPEAELKINELIHWQHEMADEVGDINECFSVQDKRIEELEARRSELEHHCKCEHESIKVSDSDFIEKADAARAEFVKEGLMEDTCALCHRTKKDHVGVGHTWGGEDCKQDSVIVNTIVNNEKLVAISELHYVQGWLEGWLLAEPDKEPILPRLIQKIEKAVSVLEKE